MPLGRPSSSLAGGLPSRGIHTGDLHNHRSNRTITTQIKPGVARAIEDAYAREYERQLSIAARWVEKTGWRLEDDHFDELLGDYHRLTPGDRHELRAFRRRLRQEEAEAA